MVVISGTDKGGRGLGEAVVVVVEVGELESAKSLPSGMAHGRPPHVHL